MGCEWFGLDELSLLIVSLSVLIVIVRLVRSVKDIKVGKELELTEGITAAELVVVIGLGSIVFFSVSRWIDFYFFFEVVLIPTFFLIIK